MLALPIALVVSWVTSFPVLQQLSPMGSDPLQSFPENQRRRLAHHHFDSFQAQHDVQPATRQMNMGGWMILFAQLNAVCVSKSVFCRHARQAIAKIAIPQYWPAAETESRCDAPFRD